MKSHPSSLTNIKIRKNFNVPKTIEEHSPRGHYAFKKELSLQER